MGFQAPPLESIRRGLSRGDKAGMGRSPMRLNKHGQPRMPENMPGLTAPPQGGLARASRPGKDPFLKPTGFAGGGLVDDEDLLDDPTDATGMQPGGLTAPRPISPDQRSALIQSAMTPSPYTGVLGQFIERNMGSPTNEAERVATLNRARDALMGQYQSNLDALDAQEKGYKDSVNIPLASLAAQFFAPTKTGGFAESVANAAPAGLQALQAQRTMDRGITRERQQLLADAARMKTQFAAEDLETDRKKEAMAAQVAQHLATSDNTTRNAAIKALTTSAKGPEILQIAQRLQDPNVPPEERRLLEARAKKLGTVTGQNGLSVGFDENGRLTAISVGGSGTGGGAGAAAPGGISKTAVPAIQKEHLNREQASTNALQLSDRLIQQADEGGDAAMGATGSIIRFLDAGAAQIAAAKDTGLDLLSKNNPEAAYALANKLSSVDKASGWDFGPAAAKSAAFRTNLLNLAFAIASSREPGKLTDKDVQNALNTISGSSDVNQLKASLKETRADILRRTTNSGKVLNKDYDFNKVATERYGYVPYVSPEPVAKQKPVTPQQGGAQIKLPPGVPENATRGTHNGPNGPVKGWLYESPDGKPMFVPDEQGQQDTGGP